MIELIILCIIVFILYDKGIIKKGSSRRRGGRKKKFGGIGSSYGNSVTKNWKGR